MGGPGSGRRPGDKIKKFKPAEPAPELTGDAASAELFTSWLARETAAGRIDRSDAKVLAEVVGKHLAALRTRHGLHELETLRDLVERQEAAIRAMRGKQTEDRYKAVEGNALGRVRVTPDGEPH